MSETKSIDLTENYKDLADMVLLYLANDYKRARIRQELDLEPNYRWKKDFGEQTYESVIEQTKRFMETSLYKTICNLEPSYFIELCEKEVKKMIKNKKEIDIFE